jgi:pantothenate kinase
MISKMNIYGFWPWIKPGSFLKRVGEVGIDIHGSAVITPFPALRKQYPRVLSGIINELSSIYSHQKPLLVGISGPRNATKSTTTEALVACLSRDAKVAALSMDDYFKPREFFKSLGRGVERKGKDPIALDFKRVADDIAKLCKGQAVRVQTRDRYKRDYRGMANNISGIGLDILLREGVSAFLGRSVIFEGREHNPFVPILSSFFALKIYLRIDPAAAEKVAFQKPEKRRSLGLSASSNSYIYRRFRLVELPRFDDHYRTVLSNADLICDLIYFNGQYELSRLILPEPTLLKFIGGNQSWK